MKYKYCFELSLRGFLGCVCVGGGGGGDGGELPRVGGAKPRVILPPGRQAARIWWGAWAR